MSYEMRKDSWASYLTEDQAWELFYKSRNCMWNEAAKWAQKEFGLDKMPSRTAFYRWKEAMGAKEHAHRIEVSLLAKANARDRAKRYDITDEEQIKNLMSVATDYAMDHEDWKTCGDLMEIALKIRETKVREGELQTARDRLEEQKQRNEILRRRLELLEKQQNEAKETVKNADLTPEEREAKIKEIFGL